jgi:DNA-binding response OmpR family regulator
LAVARLGAGPLWSKGFRMNTWTILLIDDDPDFVEATCTVLESAPYSVLVAYSGEEGLNRAREDRPDLIILDVIMPGEDGFRILERLRADRMLAHIPVVMLTSLPNGLNLASRGGANTAVEDYIDKPIRPAELLSRVEKLLAKRNTQDVVRNNN